MNAKYPLLLLWLCVALTGQAQKWVEDITNPAINFYTVKQEYQQWYEVNKEEIRERLSEEPNEAEEEEADNADVVALYKYYNRWAQSIEYRMTRTGGVREGAFDSVEYRQNLEKFNRRSSRSGSLWTYTGLPAPVPYSSYKAMGRLNCLAIDPVDTNIMYVGAAEGGIWKSTDGGENWVNCNTDHLPLGSIADIAVRPDNHNIIFAATGDFSYWSSGLGVIKSTDGGQNWGPTGLTFTLSQGRSLLHMAINPLHPDTMYVTGNKGLYRSFDGGNTWALDSSMGYVFDVKFRPGNPNVLCTSNGKYNVSTDGGLTWTRYRTGLDTTRTYFLGLTAADTNYIYMGANWAGVYVSTDGGQTFTARTGLPNVGGVSTTYNNAFGTSNTDKNFIALGGIAMYYSKDAGLTWKTPLISPHADYHRFVFDKTNFSKAWALTDGGLFVARDTGNSWYGINKGIAVGEVYKFSVSGRTPGKNISGRQDMGTQLMTSQNLEWTVFQSDGMDNAIDPTNDSVMYFSYYGGSFFQSLDGGLTNHFMSFNGNGQGSWVTPMKINPRWHLQVYITLDSLCKSSDGGKTWRPLNTSTNKLYVTPCPSDTMVVYCNNLVTHDAGQTFTPMFSGSGYLKGLEVDEFNADRVWAFSDTVVYFSSDGGINFVHFDSGLPQGYFPSSIIRQFSAPDALYLGLKTGEVYYRDSTMSAWIPYYDGLPNCNITDLEISYTTQEVWASTYGRDLWKAPLYSAYSHKPVAYFVADKQNPCAGEPVHLSDSSSFNPTSWQWFMPGATPNYSTAQNPVVTYSAPGDYYITFIATNQYGSDTFRFNSFIWGTPPVRPLLTEDFETATGLPEGWSTKQFIFNYSVWKLEPNLSAHNVGHQCLALQLASNRNGSRIPDASELRLPTLDLTNAINPHLSFDYSCLNDYVFDTAHVAGYNFEDTLQLLVTTDCGNSYDTIFTWTQDDSLDTRVTPGFHWSPNANEWRTCNYDLSAYQGLPEVLICFRLLRNARLFYNGYYSNNLYLDNVNVTVPAPVSFLGYSSDSVCAGQPVTLIDASTGAGSVQWLLDGGVAQNTNTNPITVYYAQPGNYTVALVAYNGNLSDTFHHGVTVLPLPALTVASDTAACPGDTITLTATGAQTYQWSPALWLSSTTVANPIAAPMAPLTYTLVGTDNLGCSDTAYITIAVNTCTGINELLKENVSVFPNPSQGMVNVSLKGFTGNMVMIEVFDQNGRNVSSQRYQATGNAVYHLNLKEQHTGAYLLKISSGGQSVSERVVIEH
jgi:PKD repeat protein/photosystem II stability/assembly factor-like uncharacterized protein